TGVPVGMVQGYPSPYPTATIPIKESSRTTYFPPYPMASPLDTFWMAINLEVSVITGFKPSSFPMRPAKGETPYNINPGRTQGVYEKLTNPGFKQVGHPKIPAEFAKLIFSFLCTTFKACVKRSVCLFVSGCSISSALEKWVKTPTIST